MLDNTPFNNIEVSIMRSVLVSIGDSAATFVVRADNLKGVGESYRDDLIIQSLSLLTSSAKRMIFYVPSANGLGGLRAGVGRQSYHPL